MRLKALYDHVLSEEYSMDDFGRLTPEVFVARLFQVNTEHFVYQDKGYVCTLNILPRLNADIHFCNWGDIQVVDLQRAGFELFSYLFDKYNLHRLTAYVPKDNEKAGRFATYCGFKYEGSLRGMFLRNDKYIDLEFFGMLRGEFDKRRSN